MGRLFGTAGLRGVFGREVTVQLALNFGNGIARMSGGGVVLGWDNRLSSHALASAAASGALSGGADVLLVGMSPFPVLARATMMAGDAGIYVTASHNPPEYNGLKAFWGDGAELTREQEEELERMIKQFAYGEVVGSIRWSPYGVEEYLEDLLEDVGPCSDVLLVADPANGAASILAPSVLSEVGARVISVNSRPDGTFPGRMPEPSPENLRETMDLVRRCGAEFGLAWDGDADRVAVIDRRGRFVPQYKVSSLAAIALKARRVITSVDMGLGLKRVVEKLGGEVIEWRLGDLHSLYKRRRKEGWEADLITEPWKIMIPSWGPFFDGIRAACLILEVVSEYGGLEEALKEVPEYRQVRVSIPCGGDRWAIVRRVFEELKEEVKPVRVDEIDGYRLWAGEESWLLLRASGTEPKIRVYAEGRSEEEASRLASIALRRVRERCK